MQPTLSPPPSRLWPRVSPANFGISGLCQSSFFERTSHTDKSESAFFPLQLRESSKGEPLLPSYLWQPSFEGLVIGLAYGFQNYLDRLRFWTGQLDTAGLTCPACNRLREFTKDRSRSLTRVAESNGLTFPTHYPLESLVWRLSALGSH